MTPRPAPHPPDPRPEEGLRDATLARLLAAERFYACPPELLARIADEAVGASWSLPQRGLAFAASVLLAVGAITALTGTLPSPASPVWAVDAAPPPPLAMTQLAVPTLALPADALRADWLPWLAASGAALVLGGILLARRWGVRSGVSLEEVA